MTILVSWDITAVTAGTTGAVFLNLVETLS